MGAQVWLKLCAVLNLRWTCSLVTMGSNSMPVRIAHGWAIAWLDFYQTPAIVSEGVVSEVKGFFKEATRSKDAYPHNHVNFQAAETNRLGRPKRSTTTMSGRSTD